MIDLQLLDGRIISEAAFRDALMTLGFDATQTNTEQLRVMCRSLDKFQDHTERLGELWREVGTDDTAHHIRHKAQRLFHAEANGPRDGDLGISADEFGIDSAVDLINYATFYVRQKGS